MTTKYDVLKFIRDEQRINSLTPEDRNELVLLLCADCDELYNFVQQDIERWGER